MHIVFLYQYFGTPGGSWSTRCYEMARRWVANGDQVTVITSPYDKSDIESKGYIHRKEIEGINLIVIDSGDSNRYSLLKRIIRAVKFALTASYYASIINSDIIIASSGPITIGIPALTAKIFRRRKYIFEVRDLWPQGAIENRLIKGKLLKSISYAFEHICYKYSEAVVTASTGMEESINNRYPYIKTYVFPNASDTDLFGISRSFVLPPYLNKDSQIFIYTGSLGLMDAVGDVIEGFSLLMDIENIHLVIIGDGNERIILEKRVKELGIDNRVHFIGLVSKYEVAAWYQVALASFVVFKNYPVWGTVSPNKMFDSFAAGVPIIQNTKGWIKDLIDHEMCGINVNANDPNSMANAIRILSKDQLLRDKFGQNARKLADGPFNREYLAKEYQNTLHHIIRECDVAK